MKIVRSILAVIVGMIVAVAFIIAIESVNGLFIHPPPDGKSMQEFMQEMENATPAAKAWLRSVPLSAMVMLQVGWGIGALLGGAVSAWIAGYARLFHAWIIGFLVLVATILNFIELKNKLDYVHPDWLLVTGLLLPMPLAVLGGWIAKKLTSTETPAPPAQAGQG